MARRTAGARCAATSVASASACSAESIAARPPCTRATVSTIEIAKLEGAVRVLHQLLHRRLGTTELARGFTQTADALLEQQQGALQLDAILFELFDDRLEAREILLECHAASPVS